jgi:glycosyltransferase involved in cell wall biosynthesis
LLAAMARLVARHPEARLVIFGRGTRAEEVVAKPMRALGLEDHVVLAGHRGDDYAALLAAMDLFAYLVPGSDGSCRALREAAALGLPLVATRRGAIPEIVVDGETGILVDEDPAALAEAFSQLIRDPRRRRAMGEAARRDARARFDPEHHAAFVEAFYAEALRSAPISSR